MGNEKFNQQLKQRLEDREANHLYRQRKVMESPQGIEVIVDGKSYINFCSNDYLGLASDPTVNDAFKKAIDKYGTGSGAAHLVTGHSVAHHALEEELADTGCGTSD